MSDRVKNRLKRLYVSGEFKNFTKEQMLTVYGSYITQEDLDAWEAESK